MHTESEGFPAAASGRSFGGPWYLSPTSTSRGSNMGTFGPMHWIILLIVILLLFGNRLPARCGPSDVG